MHAMSTLQYEDDILERLATLETPRQFVAEVVVIIEELVDRLIRGAFRQDDYAVKYAIEPLLNQEGPLSDLGLRLKLLLALGLISPKIYHDLEVFLGLHDLLSEEHFDYRFCDPVILAYLGKLNSFSQLGLPPLPSPDADTDMMLYRLQLNRQDQMVRSALQLAVTALAAELGKESPI